MNENENNSIRAMEQNDMGEVFIANDVIATIACVAATEVEGVSSMVGSLPNEILGRLGAKNVSKGAKISLDGKQVFVDLSIHIYYGYSIPKICAQVQERVTMAIHNMTGLQVMEVNIHVVGVQNRK